MGTETGEKPGHGWGIACGAEQGMNSSAGDGRKEIPQIEAQHDRLARMESGVGEDRKTTPETVGRGMWRNQVEEIVQLFGMLPSLIASQVSATWTHGRLCCAPSLFQVEPLASTKLEAAEELK